MSIEENISNYVKAKGITISAISRETAISYGALYDSLCAKGSERELRSKELMAVCRFLEKDPRNFEDKDRG